MKNAKGAITLSFFLLLIMLSACTRFHVYVNGFQNPSQPIPLQATFIVFSIAAKENDLEFQEYSRMIEKKLEERGYRKAEGKMPDLAIYIAYGIDDGTTRNFAYSTPVYGQKGGGTSTFSGTSFGNKGVTNYSGTIQSQPSYGVVGSQTVSESYDEYKRILIIDVVDAQKSQKEGTSTSLWKGEITSRGYSSDLRLVMPYLIEAAFQHFGENTKKGIRHVIYEDAEEIKKLQGVQ